MASFKYTGDDVRQFPSDDGENPSLEVSPGDVVEADRNPDPAYFAPAKSTKSPAPEE